VTRAGALRDALLAVPALVLGAAPTWWVIGRPASFPVVIGILYAVLATLIVRGAPADVPGPGLGAANRITLLRACLALPIGALAIQPVALGPAGNWWVIVLATAAMVLDGLDGRVARRTGTSTAFGARFDMELDAALIMALCVLVRASGKVGVWVLLIGLMRYVFVAAGRVVPALTGALPDSFRRKTVCVVQGVVLLVALGPIIPTPMAVFVTAVGLATLAWSFGVDTAWLLRHPGGATDRPEPQ